MLTLGTQKDRANGLYYTRLNDGTGKMYHGIGSTREESNKEAMLAYRAAESEKGVRGEFKLPQWAINHRDNQA